MLKSLKYIVAMGLIALGYADSAKAGMFDNISRRMGEAAGPGSATCTRSVATAQKAKNPKNYAFAMRCATEVDPMKIKNFSEAFVKSHCTDMKKVKDKTLKVACKTANLAHKTHKHIAAAKAHDVSKKESEKKRLQHEKALANQQKARDAHAAAIQKQKQAEQDAADAENERAEAEQAQRDDSDNNDDGEQMNDEDQDGAAGGDEGEEDDSGTTEEDEEEEGDSLYSGSMGGYGRQQALGDRMERKARKGNKRDY
ncbi:hypothetical protein [Candidatus Finniella inopinata]|uniref:Uncharacterized protein n=1 Tax=Candidatus Finniella inopinata TaxID=1696036 RepID=A0A4Q7DGN3_9PROT|nr:hypothetical protein [Candidatus Finniella inopinata]RZI45832.1 hypothetical protein EQU50_05200 [Candidatus Finniella inopinata]